MGDRLGKLCRIINPAIADNPDANLAALGHSESHLKGILTALYRDGCGIDDVRLMGLNDKYHGRFPVRGCGTSIRAQRS
jgi:hypothetical protein